MVDIVSDPSALRQAMVDIVSDPYWYGFLAFCAQIFAAGVLVGAGAASWLLHSGVARAVGATQPAVPRVSHRATQIDWDWDGYEAAFPYQGLAAGAPPVQGDPPARPRVNAIPPPPSAEEHAGSTRRSVGSQAPTTYKRNIAEPRFHVLPDTAWG